MRRALVAAVLAAAALGVGGCHAAASSTSAPPAATGATTADPLSGVDAQLDQIERGLDADAGAAG